MPDKLIKKKTKNTSGKKKHEKAIDLSGIDPKEIARKMLQTKPTKKY